MRTAAVLLTSIVLALLSGASSAASVENADSAVGRPRNLTVEPDGNGPIVLTWDALARDGDSAGEDNTSGSAYSVSAGPLLENDPGNGRVNPAINGNDPPAFDESSYSRSIFENAPSGTLVGEPIAASFDGDLNYTLAGTDSGNFEITSSGQIKATSAIGDYEDSQSQKSFSLTVNVSADSDSSLQAQAQVTVTVIDLIEDDETATIGDVTWTRIPATRFLIAYQGTGSNQTRRPDLEINFQPQCEVNTGQRLDTDMWVDGQQLKIRWRLVGEDAWRPTDSDDPDHPDWLSYDLTATTGAARQGMPSSCAPKYNEIWNDAGHIFAADITRHLITAYRLSEEGTVLTRARDLDIPLIDDHYFSHFRVGGMWGDSTTIWATQARDGGGTPRSAAYDRTTFKNVPGKNMAFDGTENVLDAHIQGDTIWVQNFNDPTKVAPYERTATPGKFHDGHPLHAKKAGVGTLEADPEITNPARITGRGDLVYVMHREDNRMSTFNLSGLDGPRKVESEFDFQDIPNYDGTRCLEAAVPYCPTGISTDNPNIMYFSFSDGQIRYIQKITPDIGDAITLSLEENSPADQNIGLRIQAESPTNPQTVSYTWTLTGDDAQYFDKLESGERDKYVHIRTKDGVDYDYEAKDEYSFSLTVTDGDNDVGTSAVTVKIIDVDEPPPPPTNVQADGGPGRLHVTWQQPTVPTGTPAISSYQVDYALCDSDGQSCNSYETHEAMPGDGTIVDGLDEKANYRLMVRSINHEGHSDWVTVSDHVTTTSNPVITGGPTFDVNENSTSVGTITVTDADSSEQIAATVTGSKIDLFDIVETDNGEQGLTITLSFKAVPDYEDQALIDISHTYLITVTAVSGTGAKEGNAETQLTVEVQNVNEDPTGKPAIVGLPEEDETLTVDISGLSDPDGPVTAATYEWLDGSDDSAGTDPSLTIKKAHVGDDIKVRVSYQAGPFAGQAESDPVGPIRGNSAPAFQGESAREVSENISGIAATFVATDANATDVVTYQLADSTIASDNALFNIDANTGEVSFKTSPNFEEPSDTHQDDSNQSGDNRYEVAIKASSGSGAKLRQTTGHFTIVVLDVDEPPGKPAAPTVTGTTVSSISISWEAPANTGPAITGYTVQFRKQGETEYDTVDHSGTTRTATITELEVNTTYLVRVRATNDEGDSEWSDPRQTETEDHPPPVFTTTDTTTNLMMAENTAAGTAIGDPVSATGHEGAMLTYSLTGADAAQFQVVGTTGQIQAGAGPYDFESDKTSYSLNVKVADQDGRSAEHPVTITLLDVDEPPDKPAAPTVTATTVSSITITWQEPGNTGRPAITGYGVQYRKQGDTGYTDAGHSGTGRTATITELVVNTTYEFQVRATNAEGTSDWSEPSSGKTADHPPPAFDTTDETTQLTMAENTAKDTNIGDPISATGHSGAVLTYSLTGADAGHFQVVGTTGQIQAGAGPYDFESDKTSYSLNVKVADQDGRSAEHPVTITLLDVDEPPDKPAAPQITATTVSSITISWQEPNISGRPDISGYGVQYRQQDGTDADYTNANHSGTTRTATISGLEANTTYLVRVRATNDEGTSDWSEPSSGKTTTTISLMMGENTPAETPIGEPISAGAHQGAVLTYSLTGADAAQFQVVGTTGQIRAAEVVYDFESDKTSYSLAVVATDQVGRSSHHPVTIELVDVDEPPDKPGAPTVTATTVSSITITWQEPGNTGRPAITGYGVQYRKQGDTGYTDAGHSGTGRTATITELEVNTTYEFQVRATNPEGTSDWSEPSSGKTADHPPPAFDTTDETTQLNMAENTAKDTNIGDPISATGHAGAVLTYSLTGADAGQFQVVGTTGQIQAGAGPYDFESDKTSYSLNVKVADQDGRSAEHPVTITLVDVEEPPGKPAAPQITATTVSSISISWEVPANTGPAITDYAVQYRKQGETNYTGVEHSGTDRTTTITGLAESTTYEIQVRATNAEGTSDWSDPANGTTGENKPPRFDDNAASELSFDENTPADRDIGTVTAVDPEGEAVSYSLVGPDRGAFNIGSDSGTISTKAGQTYDYETKASYEVTVSARDASGVSGQHDVAIRLNDVDEPPLKPEPPEITATTASSITITWQQPGNTGPAINGYGVEYRKQGDTNYTDAGHSGTGLTATIAELEADTTYEFQVRATNDEGIGAWSDPSRAKTTTTTSLMMAENTPAETPIGEPISAGAHVGAMPRYSLTGDDADQFRVVEDTGQIQAAEVVYDFESDKISYSLAVVATDQEGRSSQHPVTIELVDIDESPDQPDPPEITATTVSSITITWQEPDISGRPAITGYGVQYRKQGDTDYTDANHSGTELTATIAGLTENTTYEIQVRATNDEGLGAWSDPSRAKTTTTTSLMMAENTPAETPIGEPISPGAHLAAMPSYSLTGADANQFRVAGSTGQIKAADGPYDFESDKTSYSLNVKVADQYDRSAEHPVTITLLDVDEPPGKPAAPQITATTVSSITISWQEPNISGRPDISGYAVQYRKQGETNYTGVEHSGTDRTTTITGLAESTTYEIQVRATNAEGTSDWSDPANGTTGENKPPRFDDNAASELSFDENTPANREIGTITAVDPEGEAVSYSLFGSDGGAFDIGSDSGAISTKAGHTYDYETKSSYQVTVSARDPSGVTGSHNVTILLNDVDEPPDQPDPPEITATTVSSITIIWQQPGNTGPAINGYGVEYRKQGDSDYTDADHSGTELTATIAGLTENTTYEIQVRATNDEGLGAWSDPSRAKTTTTTSLMMAENTPAETPIGEPISAGAHQGAMPRYSLTGDDADQFRVVEDTGQIQAAEVVYDFESDKISYSLAVVATDQEGRSSQHPVTIELVDIDEPPDQPDPPEITATTVSSITITWQEPDISGRPAITGYGVQYRKQGDTDYTDANHSGTELTATIAGLTENTTYEIQVRATNDEGLGAWSNPSREKTTTTTSLMMAENTPAETPIGEPISAGAHVGAMPRYSLTGDDADQFQVVASTGQIQAAEVIYDFESDKTSYSLAVVATDQEGGSSQHQVTIELVDVDEPPGKPTAPTVTGTTVSSISISWEAPANTGPAITDYAIQYRKQGETNYTSVEHSGMDRTTTITGLAENTTYEIQVRATNAEGTSDWSDPANGTTGENQRPVSPTPGTTPAPTPTPAMTPTPAATPTPIPTLVATPATTPTPIPTKRGSGGGGGSRGTTTPPTVEPIKPATLTPAPTAPAPTPRPTSMPAPTPRTLEAGDTTVILTRAPEATYIVTIPTSAPTSTPVVRYTVAIPTSAPTPTPMALNPGAFLSNTPTPAIPASTPKPQPTGVTTPAPTPTPEPVSAETPQALQWDLVPNWLWWFILGLIILLVLLVFLIRLARRRLLQARA